MLLALRTSKAYIYIHMGHEQLNGQLIADYLSRTNVTRPALAAQLGVCRSILDNMVGGYLPKRNRDAILSRLAQVLGVGVGALILRVPEAKTA